MIWSITFFVWYTHSTSDDEVDKFKRNWDEEVFSIMEMMKQPYDAVMNMPVQKLKNLFKWKTKLEDDKEKILKELKNG
ncbi:unnamed protein product [marine sediment metagenome]|uniref:Uncharacterized protein n=1 Tax=marine sediment metagenome TaxID=412755 RepID=X1C7Z2_9ZZZZ